MAKKSTWEKRANKVKKEEHLVLGGSTKPRKSTLEKPSRKPYDSKGERPKSFRDQKSDLKRPKKFDGGDEIKTNAADRRPRRMESRDSSASPKGEKKLTSRKPRFEKENDRKGRSEDRRPRRTERRDRSERTDGEKGFTSRKLRFDKDGDGKGRSEDRRPRRTEGRERSERPTGERRFDSRKHMFDREENLESRSEDRKPRRFDRSERSNRPQGDRKFSSRKPRFDRDDDRERKFERRKPFNADFRSRNNKKSHKKFLDDKPFAGFESRGKKEDDLIRLNKYLSIAGICSRREADIFIEQGLVTVNGKVVTELGTKVKPTDDVKYAGEKVKAETLRYILLNKPKDCITTLSDEKGRSTVIGLVKNACRERVYPVGRLDRNTTGLILLTNDGDMAKKLSHPSHEVRKVYHVITDKNVTQGDLKKLESGVILDDGMARADAALFAGDGSVKTEIGLEIHSGKNRVVRRMFAALGYEVIRLDRAAFAGLSKKGLPRGRWRFLTEKEISYLRML